MAVVPSTTGDSATWHSGQYTSPTVPPPVYPVAPTIYSSFPQYKQAQELFQRDAQSINPEALESVKAAIACSEIEHKTETFNKRKPIPRKAAGQTWVDPTLAEWPENDYRLFCGNLGNEVNDDILSKAFSKYPFFNRAKVVREKRLGGKTKGYGFVSFSNQADLVAALKEMNGKYVGNRPIQLKKSDWKARTDTEAVETQKYSQKKTKRPRKSVLHK
ncbi:hypothetical protein ABFS82_09G054000 [Erythranthe guttata]|uniref:RNA-binding protein 42-like isoform X2 n=1 Tax=Erythranthe guttata TaxID=4155 RepID=UPI00064DF9F1|nr:PREDICTED: RNA-binding protein 42-like isoform X2 [Erythranthe guttata]|eukprot:XP_012827664.1 PREDICTED: RNA-binding protein 42-like isoform X2 [Erythranthe guttata]